MAAMLRRLAPAAAAALVLSASTLAGAHGEPVEDDAAARADALFARGKADMAAGRVARACAAFDESYALDPSEGTLLALGLCHEKAEELVRAFRELRDVHASALASGREDRQRVARAALARVGPRIGRVVIRADGGDRGGCESVTLDGAPLGPRELGVELPVEPGSHRVACERGRVAPWAETVALSAGALGVVVVPAAGPAGALGDPARADAAAARGDGAPRTTRSASGDEEAGAPTLGFVLGGAGVVALGVGAFFGVRAFDQWATVEAKCEPAACADASARADAEGARTSATVANVAVVAGVVLVVAGVYVLFTTPRATKAPPSTGRARAELLPPRLAW